MVEHQGQQFVIDAAQVLVAGQEQSAIQQSPFGKNQGIVYFLSRQQAARADLARHFIHETLGASQFEEGRKRS